MVWQLQLIAALFSASLAGPIQGSDDKLSDPKDGTHSVHGPAFDRGPRQRARLMADLGNVHFPVTTKSKDAQRFIDQGVNMVYSFWWYEAERAFRQAAMLDPNCAMAYWGMAISVAQRGFGSNQQAREILKLAVKLKPKVTDRERRYIDAYAIAFADGKEAKNARENFRTAMAALITAYPKDNEAKAMYGWRLAEWNMYKAGKGHDEAEAMLQAVIAKNPKHPGAHHMRIHLWDYVDPAKSLDSCRAYTAGVPNIGHAQHMPGHIYSQLGLWEQAVIAMDAGSRVERRYMFQEGRMPIHTWNYGHNQEFMIACLGSMGRIADGVDESKELLRIPGDPLNEGRWTDADSGRVGLLRMLVRGERWDDLLDGKTLVWPKEDTPSEWLEYGTGMAHLGKGNLDLAEQASKRLAEIVTKDKSDLAECADLELRGRLQIAQGKIDEGLASLKSAVAAYNKFTYSDPHPYPRPVAESYVWALLQANKPEEAIAAAAASLKREPNNAFIEAMMVDANLRLQRLPEAKKLAQAVETTWRYSDPDLPALRRFQGLLPQLVEEEHGPLASGWDPEPWNKEALLGRYGPARWQPFPAQELNLTGIDGKSVRLADLRGKNVVLIFYLGGLCKHCMSQLKKFADSKQKLADLNTVVLAASTDSAATNREFLKTAPKFGITLVTDKGHATAKRYGAYDEFESKELHATYLIDAQGKVWWFRAGSEPFGDVEDLAKEIARMNSLAGSR